MTHKQFYDLVVKMREEQKKYFKSRSMRALADSKKLEGEIDDEIIRVNNIINESKQINLFENEK